VYNVRRMQLQYSHTSGPSLAMEVFIHCENLKLFKSHLVLAQDDAQRQLFLRLLAEEEAKAPVATR